MSTPRPPVQLVETTREVRAVGRDNPRLDVTRALDNYRQHSCASIGIQLSGYIVKSRSPSCGLDTTPVFNREGEQVRTGSGLQADYFRRQLPWLQMIDEYGLATEAQCEQFLVRCLALADVRTSSNSDQLKSLHRHYASLIRRMAMSHQRCIASARDARLPQRYWQAFGIGLQSLFINSKPIEERALTT